MSISAITQKDTARAATQQAERELDNRVYVSLHFLLSLQHKATGFSFLPRQPIHSLLSGRHASKVRGRGLNFEEIRGYHPGDDIRTIDWKITARIQKPHIRVYTEERERPALLLVDQRIGMFFGTRVNLKSVTAAEAAALGAWRTISVGDRVGALVFNDTDIVEIRPHRSRRNVMQILSAVVEMNHMLRADLETHSNLQILNHVLEKTERIAGHDYLIVIISDFEGANDTTQGHFTRLARHNDVIGILVHDPSATELPPSGDFVVSNGELQVELELDSKRVRQNVHEIAKGRIAEILEWSKEIRVPILPINTAEGVAEQVRHLLGTREWSVTRKH